LDAVFGYSRSNQLKTKEIVIFCLIDSEFGGGTRRQRQNFSPVARSVHDLATQIGSTSPLFPAALLTRGVLFAEYIFTLKLRGFTTFIPSAASYDGACRDHTTDFPRCGKGRLCTGPLPAFFFLAASF
jgi:hypothetical protein